MTELLKTLLIVFLSITMILLTVCFFMVTVASDALSLDDLIYEFRANTKNNETQPDSIQNESKPAAFPCQLSFMAGGGQLYMPISPREYDSALDNIEQFFEEAIGSADNHAGISQDEYILSLLSPGILCSYDYPVPFYMLCHWADSDYAGENINVSSLLIFSDTENVNIHIKDDKGIFHSFATKADASFIQKISSEYSPNGTISILTNSQNTAPDLPILSGGISLPSYSVSTTYNIDDIKFTHRAMSLLSINPYLASVYKDGDTTIYVEANNRMHLYPDGHLSYSVADASGGIPVLPHSDSTEQADMLSMLESVRRIVFPIWENLSSDMVKLSLSSVEQKDGVYTIYFDAYIGGCYISRGDTAAAAAMVEDGKITNISIYPLTLKRHGDVSVLPYKQAQAAAHDNAVLRIHYILKEDVSLIPVIGDVREGE